MATPKPLVTDFRSDTLTQPSDEMKAFMMRAPLGDDVYGEDPTTRALQHKVAVLTGFEAALWFPTGSMANLAALMGHAEPGQTLYAGGNSHQKIMELGSYARLAGLNLCEIDDQRGFLDLESLRRAWSPEAYYMPAAGVVAAENTHNLLGGLIYPEPELAALRAYTRKHQVPLHLDGARLWNAFRATGKPLTYWTRHVDSVMLSLSKGLGAPMGSVLAGPQVLINKLLRIRKLLGGGLRQSGIAAAAGIYALDHHLPLLDRDHERCLQVYDSAKDLPGISANRPQTNILVLGLADPNAGELVSFLAERNIFCSAIAEDRVRLVFHLNNSDVGCEELVENLRRWGGGL